MVSSPDDINPRPSKRTKHDFLEYIAVLVGDDEATFAVHKTIACKTSAFFRTAMKEEWKEGGEKTVALPETKSDIFGIYNGWLYTGTIDMSVKSNDDEGGDIDNKHWDWDLIDAYALGDYLQDTTFKNAVSDAAIHEIEKLNTVPGIGTIRYLWEKVPHNSRFAKMAVDYISADYCSNAFAASVSKYPSEFVGFLATVCVEDRHMDNEQRKPANRPKCYYHEHDNDEDKCP